jgi:hypothetical protein
MPNQPRHIYHNLPSNPGATGEAVERLLKVALDKEAITLAHDPFGSYERLHAVINSDPRPPDGDRTQVPNGCMSRLAPGSTIA